MSLAARRANLRTGGVRCVAEIDRDLVEWNYGDYEGLRTVDIHAKRPDWESFRDGCPNGESPDQVGARADRVLTRVRPIKDSVLIFSSGHFLRVFGACWLGLEAAAGKYFMLNTASLRALSYENEQPAIQFSNDTES